ncbi:hypothetical protein QYF61_001804 [Mycteria americana]|uniref:Uncharacterized protein n=1 Tax=Mycteria americana TaxID=33587 RepID=A0AAN7NR67_MYCAM|nr:hypothetical protein QYF61_001804 [Mycteria americana]
MLRGLEHLSYEERLRELRLVTEHWQRLPREIAESPSLEILNSHLDLVLVNWLTMGHLLGARIINSVQRNLQRAMRSPPSLLFSKLDHPKVLSHSSQDMPSSPFTSFVALLWTHSRTFTSFLNFGAQNCPQYSRCRIRHFDLLNFIPFIIAQCSNLSRSLCKASCPSRESNGTSQFGIISKLANGAFNSCIQIVEPMPAGSKMDPPLAKAEPISDGGSASVITYLRRGKKLLCNSSQERGVRVFERNNSADTKVSEEGGGGGAPGTGAEIPLQPVVKTMVRQAVPLQPMDLHSGADIHLQPVEDPMPEKVDASEADCDPMESPCWSRLLAGPVTLWRERSPLWSRFAGRTCDPVGDPRWSSLLLKDCTPWKGPMLEQFVKNCSLWEALMLENFMEDCLLWEGLHTGAGEECEESSP